MIKSLAIIIAYLFSVSFRSNIENNKKCFNKECLCSEKKQNEIDSVSIKISEEPYNINEISIEFIVNNPLELTGINYSDSNLIPTYTFDKENCNYIDCDLLLISTEGSCLFDFYINDELTFSKTIFALDSEYGVFVSDVSIDDCYDFLETYEQAFSEEVLQDISYDSNTFSTNKKDALFNVISEKYLTESPVIEQRKGNEELICELRWNDIKGIPHPLVGIRVDLYVLNIKIDTTYTDESGLFSFYLNNTNTIKSVGKIKIYAANAYCTVKSLTIGTTPYCTTLNLSFFDFNTGTGKTSPLEMDCKSNKALQIATALYWGGKYAEAMENRIPPHVNVKYPSWTCGSCSDRHFKTIYLHTNDFLDWDVILHEYGHQMQYWLKIENSPEGSHSSSADDTTIFPNKEKGLKLAWGESWPTVFAILVTQYFKNEIGNLEYIGDYYYQDRSDTNIAKPIPDAKDDLENADKFEECMVNNFGDACEIQIMRVLYDLYDDDHSEPFDGISLGHEGLWEMVSQSKATTFSEFAAFVYSSATFDIESFDQLLSEYHFAQYDAYLVTNENGNKCISWAIMGDYLNYIPMNSISISPTNFISNRNQLIKSSKNITDKYVLTFFDETDKEIFKTGELSMNSYVITESNWCRILSSPGKTFFVKITSFSTTYNFTSGPYSSKKIQMYKTSVDNTFINLFTSDYSLISQNNNYYHFSLTNEIEFDFIFNSITSFDAFNYLMNPNNESHISYIDISSDYTFSYLGINVSFFNSGERSDDLVIGIAIENNNEWTIDGYVYLDDVPIGSNQKYFYQHYFESPQKHARFFVSSEFYNRSNIVLIGNLRIDTKYQFILKPYILVVD